MSLYSVRRERKRRKNAPVRSPDAHVLLRPERLQRPLEGAVPLEQHARQRADPVKDDEVPESRHGEALARLPLHPERRADDDLREREREEQTRRERDVERGEQGEPEREGEVAVALPERGRRGGELVLVCLCRCARLGRRVERAPGTWGGAVGVGGRVEEGKEVVRDRVAVVVPSSRLWRRD